MEGGVFGTIARDVSAAPSRLWNDTRAVYRDRSNLGLLLGASAYAYFHERHWEDQEAAFFRNHTLFGRNIQDGLAALGNGLFLYGGAVAWYVTALTRDQAPSYENSKTVLSALTVTSFSTLLLKATIPDSRPGSGVHDFPSGHASLAMAAATSLDELYGHPVGVPAYALATLVGLQRLDVRKHDTGAVVFGWILGFVVGRTVAGGEPPTVLGLELGLYQEPETGALGISLSGGR